MNNKKMNNKGFTLVELIVVLVILAILAAILVPALLGYIDRARGAQVLLNAKSVLTAAQAEASNCYGTAGTKDDGTAETISDMFTSDKLTVIADTADIPAGASATVKMKATAAAATPANHDAWTVEKVLYTENGQTAYYDGKSWTQGLSATELTKAQTAVSGGFSISKAASK